MFLESLMLVIVLIFAFLLRFIFVFSETSDTLVHLWQIKKQKLNKDFSHRPFKSILSGRQAYPSLAHAVIVLFPERYYKIAGILLNLLYDILSILVVYLLSDFLEEEIIPSAYNFIIPFDIAITLIFATTPVLLTINARLRSLGARTFGLLLTIVFFSITGWAVVTSSLVYYLIAIPVVILIFMSSQFAIQAIVLFSLFYGILTFNFLPFLAVLLGFGTGYLFPFTGIKHFAKYKTNHYIWYFRNYKKGTTAAQRNNLKDFVKLPYYFFRDPSRFAETWFGKNSFLIAAYSLPALLFILIILISGDLEPSLFFKGQTISYITYIFVASFIVFLLTSFKPFLFLGSPERYFEYSLVFLSVLFVYTLFSSSLADPGFFYVLVLLINMIVVFINLLYVLYGRANLFSNFENAGMNSLLEFISNKLSNANILTVPTKLSYGLAFATTSNSAKFYYPFISGSLDGFKYMENEEVELYHVKPDFEYFTQNYGIDYVVIENSILQNHSELAEKYKQQLDKAECLFKNQDYSVYRIK